jgi:aminopeptidase-like protein
MSFSGMEVMINYYYQIIIALEQNKTYQSLNMKCEPFLQNKGLYNSTGGPKSVPLNTSAALWLLNQADGTNDLITISNKSSIPISTLHNVACALKDSKLIIEI